ncbi:MAG: glycogen-binding domain-containing protein [Myxococcales bacterium]
MEKLTLALLATLAVAGAACRAHAPVPSGAPGTTLVECSGGARDELRLVGSFDEWQAGVTMARGDDGLFFAHLSLPPGVSTVACWRRSPDGTVVTSAPLNAPEVEADGFGGENGVFEGARAGGPVTSKQ